MKPYKTILDERELFLSPGRLYGAEEQNRHMLILEASSILLVEAVSWI